MRICNEINLFDVFAFRIILLAALPNKQMVFVLMILRNFVCVLVQLTNDSLCSIATLAKLESLVMVGCPCVDDVGLRFLENGCPLLKVNSLHLLG